MNRRERSHTGDFTGDRFFISRKDAKKEQSDRTVETLQAIALLSHTKAQRKRAMPSAGFAYAHWRFCRRSLFYLTQERRERSHNKDFAGDRFF
ncbi:hypothetical protein [Nostoc sp. WHI]|uniref:hypothetical protein n=1 Tax=Nostoc sp. WHI TaxID=2650611 RepID=UPI0018C60E43|nr:hypothetical protein [Nostoc sp. WHI]MBG1265731.1 hypothetical protein [Nostoc sp. WHI]